ncbi:hypothetical protein CHELA40_14575 [Chelatococcus asaccharovorans]|nr:hypothetical protein CHELA40_14575 [Chelatococcus asaccharovorans]
MKVQTRCRRARSNTVYHPRLRVFRARACDNDLKNAKLESRLNSSAGSAPAREDTRCVRDVSRRERVARDGRSRARFALIASVRRSNLFYFKHNLIDPHFTPVGLCSNGLSRRSMDRRWLPPVARHPAGACPMPCDWRGQAALKPMAPDVAGSLRPRHFLGSPAH